mgnify:CR=1 FL=1
MEDGTIYLKRHTMQSNGLKPGDIIYIHTDNGYRKKFEIKGSFKDAFMGSDMMGAERYIISEADFREMLLKSRLPIFPFTKLIF